MRVRQRLGGVARDVEHGLDQLFLVAPEFGNRGVVVAPDRQAAGEFGQHQAAHPLAHLVDVDVADDVRAAVRRQQAVDQRLQPVRFLDDDLGVLAQLDQVDRRQLQFEQLGGAADAAQRVLDLVRQVADQFLVDLALVEDALLAVELELLDVLAQLDDDFAVAGGADDAVHVQRFAPAALEREVLAQVGVLVRQRLLAQPGQFLGVDEQRRQLQCA